MKKTCIILKLYKGVEWKKQAVIEKIMNIEEVISEEIINLNMEVSCKREAINGLIDLLYDANRLKDKEKFLHEVMEREKTETTDLGFGVAIPHGLSESVKQASVAIGKLQTPIQWQDGDISRGAPVYAIFLMASSPNRKGRSHIEIISKVASLLIEDEFVEFLKKNDSKTALLKEIKLYLGDA